MGERPSELPDDPCDFGGADAISLYDVDSSYREAKRRVSILWRYVQELEEELEGRADSTLDVRAQIVYAAQRSGVAELNLALLDELTTVFVARESRAAGGAA